MFHEYRDLVTELKGKDAHFEKVFDRHNELDQRISDVEEGREHLSDYDLAILKKEKLQLKDEAYQMLMNYKNSK